MKANARALKVDSELTAARFEVRRQAWEQVRRHGMILYVLMRWVLGTAIPGAFLLLVFDVALGANGLRGVRIPTTAGPYLAVLAGAVLLGVLDWQWNEKRYGKE